jgi:Ni/Co efflux regulator RcnB
MTVKKISAIAGAILLVGGLLAGAGAQAQPGQRDHSRDHMRDARPDYRQPHERDRNMAPPPRMEVGHRVPNDYRGNNDRVDNWQHYHLRRPGRGQHWVQYGGQFLLIDAGGLVVQLFAP